MMIRIEAESNESDAPGSLMDRILMGLITQLGMIARILSSSRFPKI